jgi:farnesyl-diphosphate farnesyltransferase
MDYPLEKKLPLLRDFNLKLEIDGWTIENVGDSPDYRILLAHFGKVISVYKSLKPEYRAVISDITKRMADGMADFADAGAKSGSGAVATVEEYNLYCHYVAGLVGVGLSQLFSASGLEAVTLRHEKELSNNMGLFLQKTNIIRDYLEDYTQARTWWPREIWGQYAPSLDWFAKNPDHPKSRACLNHMVTDAFSLVPDCLKSSVPFLRSWLWPLLRRFMTTQMSSRRLSRSARVLLVT